MEIVSFILLKCVTVAYLIHRYFFIAVIIKLEDAIIVPKLVIRPHKYITHEINNGSCVITIPYFIMAKKVFDPVVDNTIELIDRQIKKANGDISRTYLVGGFGGSPYLRKKILKKFHRKSDFPNLVFDSGLLITDTAGNSAAMRGAMVYGIDGSRRKPQTDVVEKKFECASTDRYNTLICLGKALFFIPIRFFFNYIHIQILGTLRRPALTEI